MCISNKRKRRINANDGNWCIQISNIVSFHIYTNIKPYELVFMILFIIFSIFIYPIYIYVYIIHVSYDFYY